MSRAIPGQLDHDERLMSRLVSEAGDPAIAPRPEYISNLRALILDRLGPPRRAPRRTMLRLLVGSGLAVLAVVAAALALTMLRSANAWAQVAKALQGRPWVHGRAFEPDGKEAGETWFSPKSGVIAFRVGAEVEYHDHALGIFTKYIAAEGVVYRLLENNERISINGEFYQQLLDPKGSASSPVPGMELVAQTRREIVEDGRTWSDIELTLRVVGGDRVDRMQFRVDPRTGLPHSFAIKSGDRPLDTTLLDYPDRGPGDIYDLGVPRTAKLVDRTPGDNLDRVLAGLKAGRVRFDNYRAIMDWGDGMNAKQVWRKGRKWRVEQLLPVSKKPPQIPGDADSAWWKAHQGDFTPVVGAVCDGEKVYYYRLEGNPFAPDAKGPPAVKLTMTQAINPSDDPLMPWPDMFPEHLSHPAVFQPTHDRDFLLDPKPADGPPGTLRLRVRDTRFPDPGRPDLYKLWIDPAASYVAVRSETSVFVGSANPPKIAYVDTRLMEGLARAPSGSWYPTRVRRTTSDFNTEQVWKYHLDFEARISDQIFQPVR
jgi:hypothetical protein